MLSHEQRSGTGSGPDCDCPILASNGNHIVWLVLLSTPTLPVGPTCVACLSRLMVVGSKLAKHGMVKLDYNDRSVMPKEIKGGCPLASLQDWR
jgi:hypothetical protein